MTREIAIDGAQFRINGQLTYAGRSHHGFPLEGLLMNSRMIQAIYDDACPETRPLLRYPDTGKWDPDRNTDEFCAQLPTYRAHGLLAVTVGLQGGGSIYAPEVRNQTITSSFTPEGELVPAYFDRLLRVIRAADAVGMVVIVNYFYVKQAERFRDERAILDAAEKATDWLLRTGHRNLLVDIANEAGGFWSHPIFHPENVHRLIDVVAATTLDGRHIPTGVSLPGGGALPTSRWLASEDFTMPHGNGLSPDALRDTIRQLRAMAEFSKRPRPILINEDSIFVGNLEAAVQEGASWGFYCQGYGSGYRDRMDWRERPRETRYEDLSGFQTLPVNWRINTPIKRAFFEHLKAMTGGAG